MLQCVATVAEVSTVERAVCNANEFVALYCCNTLPYVAVCCTVMQCVAVSDAQLAMQASGLNQLCRDAVRCSVLLCVAVCCSKLRFRAARDAGECHVLVAVCCTVSQYVAVCCSM